MKSDIKEILICPADFYRGVLRIAVPIMIQNGITNVVSMLDNVMVGQVGTEAMSGVSIVNQLMFVFYLCIFGGMSGIGIFSAQFWGKGDQAGMQYTMRAKLLLGFLLTAVGAGILLLFGPQLIGMFLHESGNKGSIEETMRQAQLYLRVLGIGMLPLALTNVYSSTLRETGQTVIPMKAGVAAVFVNLIGNYILIYGKLGFPAMGVAGAAAATVISRFVEMFSVMIWTHTHPKENPYIPGCYRSFRIPLKLFGSFFAKGMPLLMNEALWSMGMTMLVQCYSVRGLNVVAAYNISNTLANVFNIVFLAMGNATAILLGQRLGAGKLKGTKLYAMRLSVFTVTLSILSGIVLLFVAPFFPDLYNTADEVRHLARGLLQVCAVCMPIFAYNNFAYFTIRSGGKTFITFLFDSCFCWVVLVPAAFVLSRYTAIPVVWMYFAVQLLEIVKSVIGFSMVRKGKWIQDLTAYRQAA